MPAKPVPGEHRLRNLRAVTDSGLARLDIEDLLAELLTRVVSALDADTAAVLLREPGSDVVIARAACGLEEEVRQGVTIPIGVGFAGQIAASRRPVALDRVDETTVANPILWEKGIRSMLGVPLMSGDDLIGVMHVGRLSGQRFTDDDAELLTIAAERVTFALQTRRLAVETAAARLLERGLVPARLPDLPGLDLAGRYVPADNRAIGGDWYDAFVSPSGQLWLVMGDVAGHGLNAAVVMARVRSALRAYTMYEDDVAQVVEMTDRKISHFDVGAMVTLACITSTPPYDTMQVCLAGHLPPVLAVPGQAAVALEPERTQPPLGVGFARRRHMMPVSLPPEAVMLLYTDGLIERRAENLDRGIERLRVAVRPNTSAEVVCRIVMHELVGRGDAVEDDIAVLAVRRVGRVG